MNTHTPPGPWQANHGSAVWEERIYERGPMLPYKGKGGRYRFNGRFLSGYPKDLEVYDYETGWSSCPNVNIGIRIQREDELFPDCVKGRHDWSRLTISQWNCKRCGGVIAHSLPNPTRIEAIREDMKKDHK